MEEAIAAQDFETAAKLRDEIGAIQHSALVRGVEDAQQASYFQRQVPGRMGLGDGPAGPEDPRGLGSAEEAGPDDRQPLPGRPPDQVLGRPVPAADRRAGVLVQRQVDGQGQQGSPGRSLRTER